MQLSTETLSPLFVSCLFCTCASCVSCVFLSLRGLLFSFSVIFLLCACRAVSVFKARVESNSSIPAYVHSSQTAIFSRSPTGWPAVVFFSLCLCHHVFEFPSLLFLYVFPYFASSTLSEAFLMTVIGCVWLCLTSLPLHSGQQPEGGQCAQTVDHRGPWASS